MSLHDIYRQAQRPVYGRDNVIHRSNLWLYNGRISDVFTVEGGPVVVTSMFMRITQAVTNTACNMAWVYDPADGSAVTSIGTALNIANYAVGDWVWSELDGTALVRIAAGALVKNVLDVPAWASNIGRGLIIPEGGIDITLSAATLLAGKGELWMTYRPLMPSSSVFIGKINSTTSTTSSTTSSSSSTSSTASTSSTSSSTTTTGP